MPANISCDRHRSIAQNCGVITYASTWSIDVQFTITLSLYGNNAFCELVQINISFQNRGKGYYHCSHRFGWDS